MALHQRPNLEWWVLVLSVAKGFCLPCRCARRFFVLSRPWGSEAAKASFLDGNLESDSGQQQLLSGSIEEVMFPCLTLVQPNLKSATTTVWMYCFPLPQGTGH